MSNPGPFPPRIFSTMIILLKINFPLGSPQLCWHLGNNQKRSQVSLGWLNALGGDLIADHFSQLMLFSVFLTLYWAFPDLTLHRLATLQRWPDLRNLTSYFLLFRKYLQSVITGLWVLRLLTVTVTFHNIIFSSSFYFKITKWNWRWILNTFYWSLQEEITFMNKDHAKDHSNLFELNRVRSREDS